MRERKQLIRAVIAEIGLTVHRQRRVADLCIVWQGGAVTEISMPMTKAGGHLRVTDEQTVALVRRLAAHYDDRAIAAILAKQKRRTATGLPFTRARVAILRANHAIPVYQPPAESDVGPNDDDALVVTITEAEKILHVSKVTLYRWIRDGFITAEQITPEHRGASASTTPCATGSGPKSPTAGSASTRPPKPSASPAKPCCTRSNAANCKPSTSTADAEKACVSRSNPTNLDYSTQLIGETRNANQPHGLCI